MNWIGKLKKVMADKAINIEQLKNKIESNGNSLSRNSISNILNGKNSPKIETVQLITNALGIELWELFSTPTSVMAETEMDGFIEYKDKIYRIKSKKDLEPLIDKPDFAEQQVTSTPKFDMPTPSFVEKTPINTIVKRKVTRNSGKLSRHIFRRYNVTICDKKELFEIPNELKRDTKIWIFRSKDDAQKAKTELKKVLSIRFNE